MKIHDCEQGSAEWLLARCGVVTASEVDALVSPLGAIRKGQGVKTYLAQKLAEKWMQAPLETFNSWQMDHGQIIEDRARNWLALHLDAEIQRPGFITTDDGRAGCSPDGMIPGCGIELKCVQPKAHCGYLMEGVVPLEYRAQVQHSLFVTGLPEWRFVSYNPSFPKLVLSVKPDPEFQENLHWALLAFCNDLQQAYDYLIELNGGPPPKRDPMTFSHEMRNNQHDHEDVTT